MPTLRNARAPLLIIAAVALIFALVMVAAVTIEAHGWAYGAPMEPVATPSGIWWVSAVKEPIFAHAWESEQHRLYRIDTYKEENGSRQIYGLWIAVDGSTVYQLDSKRQRMRTLHIDADIDWDALPYFDNKEAIRWNNSGSYHLMHPDSIYFRGEIIDQKAGITWAQFGAAVRGSYHIAIPLEGLTRVYCNYSNNNRSVSQRYDLP